MTEIEQTYLETIRELENEKWAGSELRLATALNNLGLIYLETGRFAQALHFKKQRQFSARRFRRTIPRLRQA